MRRQVENGVLNYASHIQDNTREQAERSARLPFIFEHVALMPDAHLGYGATVGSVIPTRGAILPSAVGVDIGCGMAALKLSVTDQQLPDALWRIHRAIEGAVPAGMGKGNEEVMIGAEYVQASAEDRHTELDSKQLQTAARQFGSLGSGNHFVEMSLDADGGVWLVLHSGSRGIGNQIAKHHIDTAKGLMARYFIELEDPDLAYFVEGTAEFDAYWKDLQWAQDYAYNNRRRMLKNIIKALVETEALPDFQVVDEVNCHHNYAALEHHMGQNIYVTRKGAISAREGQRGIIPGSMGTSTFLVEGKGAAASFTSAPHGAGRRMSRGEARRTFTAKDLADRMEGKTWNDRQAKQLVDEIPDSYKDIHTVMEDSADLATITHELHQVVNYKGA